MNERILTGIALTMALGVLVMAYQDHRMRMQVGRRVMQAADSAAVSMSAIAPALIEVGQLIKQKKQWWRFGL